MTLKDLILVQSVFQCETANEILELINLQPNHRIFYSSFMELDFANLT